MADTFEGEIIEFYYDYSKPISIEFLLPPLTPDIVDILFGTDERTIEGEVINDDNSGETPIEGD